MSPDELEALIAGEIENAMGREGSRLASERAESTRYYLGEKFGNEVEGRSQVVSSDVADTIEWMMPHLIRIFASGDNTVSFDPVGVEDIAAAEQATEFANHIWNQDNDGFLNFYTWFKDALLSKNGFVKIWWEDSLRYETEEFHDLKEEERAFLLATTKSEVIHEAERHEPNPVDPDIAHLRYDLTLKHSFPDGRVQVAPVPPEEFLISSDARTIEDARFVAHRTRRTLSSLVSEGFDEGMIQDLAGEASEDHSAERQARGTVGETDNVNGPQSNNAMTEVWVTECYLRVDMDGDGIAERRQILVAGSGAHILSNVIWEDPVPFASLSPILMPHQFYGLAVADLVKDIQLIKSTIMRQYLDGLYLANNPRQEAVEANIVEPSELLTSRPGGIVRVKERGSINPIAVPFIGDHALRGLDYVDRLRENRSGVSPRTQGLGDGPLHKTAAGQRMMLGAAQGKIELIARIFAETGVKRAFKIIFALVSRYQQKERVIRLRNEWVAMNPKGRPASMDLRINVGLGFGDKETQLAHAMKILELQKQALEHGFASPANMLETVEIIVNAMGFKGADRFFSIPTPPGVAGAAIKGAGPQSPADKVAAHQIALMQNQAALKQEEDLRQLERDAVKFRQERQLKEIELQHKFEVDRLKMENDLTLKREEAAQELQLKREEAAMELSLKGQVEGSKAVHSQIDVR